MVNSEHDFIQNLIKTKLNCGKTLIELTTHNKVQMWWFVNPDFHQFISRLLGKDSFRKLRHETPLVFLYGSIEFFLNILKIISINLIKFLFEKEKKITKKKLPLILMNAKDIHWRLIKNYKTKKVKKSDIFFDFIIKRLNNQYELVGTYHLGVLSIKGLKIYFDKLRNWYVRHIPFDLYWNYNVWKKENETSRHFKKVWNIIKNDKVFKELCIYDKKNLYKEIKLKLKTYFYIAFPFVFQKNIEISRIMIKEIKPALFLLMNEYGSFEQSLISASKIENVPTIAIQHGTITPTHYGYIFRKEDKGKIILPDLTCVYGEYHYDLLTKESIYDPNQVIVTGQPRYDMISTIEKIYSKERFLARYNINPKHKIILWTTQCHGMSNKENIRNIKSIFETMRHIKDTTLIIKQHPGESKKNTKMIENFLNKYQIDAVLTPKNSDTFEQLFICDLMITKRSTTALEAVALKKPVIILNLSGVEDTTDYVKEGVAIGVYKEEDLKPSIVKLLEEYSNLAKNRMKFIEKHLYKIDGKATERVANIIEKTIDNFTHKKIQ